MVANSNRKQSWRQATPKRANQSSLLSRRIATTLLLLTTLGGVAWVVYFLATRSNQRTHVLTLFTASYTTTGDPESPFTIPPLRFGYETLSPLRKLESPLITFSDDLSSDFDRPDRFSQSLKNRIVPMAPEDALILFVEAKGISHAKKAYFLSGKYNLPFDPDAPPDNAIPFSELLSCLATHPGPVLLLADWGNLISDGRIGISSNDFLSIASSELKDVDKPNLFCLFSHLPNQMALDDLRSRQSIFSRACVEALLGEFRTPNDYQSTITREDQLSVGEFAEYVIRRVHADTNGQQIPWLAQGMSGWFIDPATRWTTQTNVPILVTDSNGNPLGMEVADAGTSDGSDGEVTDNADKESTDEDSEKDAVADQLRDVWTSLAKFQSPLRLPSANALGITPQSLEPLLYKRLVCKATDLEMRRLAGIAFENQVDDSRKNLLNEIESAFRIATATSNFDSLPTQRPDAIDANAWRSWQDRVTTWATVQAWSSEQVEYRNLQQQLEAIGVSNLRLLNSDESVREIPDFADESINWTRIRSEWVSRRQSQQETLDRVVRRCVDEPNKFSYALEILFRFPFLSSENRSAVVSGLKKVIARGNASWPTGDLRLLAPPEPMQRPESFSAREWTRQLITAAREFNEQNSTQWKSLDGRDLAVQTSDSLKGISDRIPVPPKEASRWFAEWWGEANAISGGQYRLPSRSDASTVRLTLRSTGEPAAPTHITIRCSGLLMQLDRATGSSGWEKDELRIEFEDFSVLKGRNEATILVKPIASATNRRLAAEIWSDEDRLTITEELEIDLPLDSPVQLVIQEELLINEAPEWRDCQISSSISSNSQIIQLPCFVGRTSNYRLLLQNIDRQLHTASIELFALPGRQDLTAAGRFSNAMGQIVSDRLVQTSQWRETGIRGEIEIPPSETLPVLWESGKSPTESDSQESAPTTTTSEALSADWGLVAVVKTDSDSTQEQRYFIEFIEHSPAEFLDFTSSVRGQEFNVNVALRDDDGDGLADLAPVDLTESPIQMGWQLDSGKLLKDAILGEQALIVSFDQPSSQIQGRLGRRPDSAFGIRFSIDSTAPRWTHYTAPFGVSSKLNPETQSFLSSIQLDEKRTLDFATIEPEELLTMNMPAEPTRFYIGLDQQSQNNPKAAATAVQLAVVDIKNRVPLKRLEVLGPYKQSWSIKQSSRGIQLKSTTETWSLEVDRRSFINEKEIQLLSRINGRDSGPLARVMVDQSPPVLVGSPEEINRDNPRLQFIVQDNSKIGKAQIFVYPQGLPKQKKQVGDDFILEDFVSRGNSRWVFSQTIVNPFKEPNTYEIQVDIEDVLGNATTLEGWQIIIPEPPAPPSNAMGPSNVAAAPPLKGDVECRILFGTGGNAPPESVQVKIVELPRQVISGKGSKHVFKGVEAGTYTVQATMTYQGVQWKAESKVVLKEKVDWKSPVKLVLSRG